MLPDWRRCLALVEGTLGSARMGRITDKQVADLQALSTALNANGRFLAKPWYQLLMQSLYRSCPSLGGWFPD